MIWQEDTVSVDQQSKDLVAGDICILLSCELLDKEQLALHKHNLVVHESDLPKGQGWSPMTWQILEGKYSNNTFRSNGKVDLEIYPKPNKT